MIRDPEPPRCDECDGILGHPANGDWTCKSCKVKALRACRKERIRKDEFEPDNPAHFRLQSRGGAWRYYKKIEPKYGDPDWRDSLGANSAERPAGF